MKKKKRTIVIGAGGTGSYFIRDYINYVRNDKQTQYKITLVDGDMVETKNLLRQCFLLSDVSYPKVDCLKRRHENTLKKCDTLEDYVGFLNTAQQLVEIAGDITGFSEVQIISCVDNNMARLRIHLGASMLHDLWDVRIVVADGGNSLWTGQTIPYILNAGKPNIYAGLYQAVTEKQTVADYEYQPYQPKDHVYNVIFAGNEEWQNTLQKGEHELSCDEVVLTSPQNIGTNMMSAMSSINLLHENKEEAKRGMNMFNAKHNVFRKQVAVPDMEETYEAFTTSLLTYIRSEEGYTNLFRE